MLRRKMTERLFRWKRKGAKKALLITGARQIGKTTLVREFAREHYRCFAELNFLSDPNACRIFENSLEADQIVTNLTAYVRKPLVPGETLILLDEVQECPRARTAVKFLVEDGRFDYVETGSLLGVRVKEVPSYPVGFEERVRMYPMDFLEFCWANGVQQKTLDDLHESFKAKRAVSESVHSTMMQLYLAYLIVGGMPEAVQIYVHTHDIAAVTTLQRDIVELYRQDIAKYVAGADRVRIKDIFDAIPSQLDDKNRRFVLANLNKNARGDRYRSSFLWLADAGVALPCYNVSSLTVPLSAAEKHSLFKLFMCDIGLLCSMSLEGIQFDILQGDLGVNMGSIAENAVAQQLLANGFPLYYFNSKKYGEVDFCVQCGKRVVPIEVKSGTDWRRHKALDNVLSVKDWHVEPGIVICKGNVSCEDNITYIPFYMTMFLEPPSLPESLIYEVDISDLG